MLKLREYQEEAVKKAINYFKSDDEEPALIVLPTAWGKSILTAFVAANIPQYEKILVVQPTKELLEQNYNKYKILCGNEAPAGIYSASFNKKQIERITYATIGSIKKIGSKFKELGFTKMLIDEAHLYPRNEESMLGVFLKESGIKQVLGITATPLKLETFTEGKMNKWSELIMLTNLSPSGNFFKKIIHIGQIAEMIKLNYWSKLIYEKFNFDYNNLKLNSNGSEYTDDTIKKTYIENDVRNNILSVLKRHSERKHCLIFVPTVEEAQILSQNCPNSEFVSGETKKKERNRIIEEFKEGKIRNIFNVGVLTTGFDYTEIDMIVLAISTASVAKYYQIVGRGVRINENKENCLICDLGGNVDRFGMVELLHFVHTDKWRMYGNKNKLLTGIPINIIGKITKEDITDAYQNPYLQQYWTFGKYKGMDISNTPHSYKNWVLGNMNLNTNLFHSLIIDNENKVKDTTTLPPETIMPEGKYIEYPLNVVPKNYLCWYYNNKNWNETNDSLKRGIELVYGKKIPVIKKKVTKKK